MLKMNNASETQVDIIKQLEKLNMWQEEQKRQLQERQSKQRQSLGLECHMNFNEDSSASEDEEDGEEDDDEEDDYDDDNDKTSDAGDMKMSDNYQEETSIQKISVLQEEQNVETSTKQNSTDNIIAEKQEKPIDIPKKTFLKKGEGIKQRFKIDPEALRLNNLPRYKFLNTHVKPNNLLNIKHKPNNAVKDEDETNLDCATSNKSSLDIQEQRFQQILISSKNVCNSTPESRVADVSIASKVQQKPQKVRFADMTQSKESSDIDQETLSTNSFPTMTWSEVLDTQQIKRIPVRRRQDDCEEDTSLNIFEMLEAKVKNESIEIKRNLLKKTMEHDMHNQSSETDDTVTDKELNLSVLKPAVKDMFSTGTSSIDLMETQESEEIFRSINSSRTEHSNIHLQSLHMQSQRPNMQEQRPNMQEQHPNMQPHCMQYNDTGNEASLGTISGSNDTVQEEQLKFFDQFKKSLFSVLQNRLADDVDKNLNMQDSELPVDPPFASMTISDDLHEKTHLIKQRLSELENEIAAFKERNLSLQKAKQEHEVEREQFKQYCSALENRFKDEKVQMEIYLYDERMKLEEEKHKFEQDMHIKRSTVHSKDRQEMLRLKSELADNKLILRQKEQTHAAAQARLRTQIRNLEKDQKRLHEEIERLNKEQKRLQSENAKIIRDSNKKMLQEINRNITKLAPKLHCSEVSCVQSRTALDSLAFKKASSVNQLQIPAQKSISIATCSSTKKILKNVAEETDTNGNTMKCEKNNEVHVEDDSCDEDGNESNNSNGEDDDINIDLEQPSSSKDAAKKNGAVSTALANENSTTFKREIINNDGSKDIIYPNGNIKKISADGMMIRMLYFNKDIKETNVNEGIVKYYYATTNTWHSTYLDGLEILEFPNGQTERRFKNGVIEVHFPNNSIKVINPSDEKKLEEWSFPDGTKLIIMRNGDKVLIFTNGQKEIQTKQSKRREYPDGTVKIVYPDGSQETRYSNGRVRLKDKEGQLLMDTENNSS